MKLGVLVALATAALMLGPSEGRRGIWIPAQCESNLPADDVIANVLSYSMLRRPVELTVLLFDSSGSGSDLIVILSSMIPLQ